MTLGQSQPIKIVSVILAMLIFIYSISPPSALATNIESQPQAPTAQTGILITQIQTGSISSASQEYVQIFNNSEEAIDITNWCLVYSSSSDKTNSSLACISSQSPAIRLNILPKKHYIFASNEYSEFSALSLPHLKFKSGLASTGGHIKILNEFSNEVDKIGWGSAASPELLPAVQPSSSEILQRKHDQNSYQDTNNNLEDFTTESQNKSPETDELIEHQIELEGRTVKITEVLPNAVGTDLGKEFIELFNPNSDSINLTGYTISLGPDHAKKFSLPNLSIDPIEYIILSDIDLGLVLPNTSADLKLFAPNGFEVSFIPPYEDLEEGQSWAVFDNSWQKTFSVTPSRPNILLQEKPCTEGKYRSQETGMCRNIESAETTPSCAPGQERNPDTNRCRKISLANSVLKQCAPGYVRNTQTNRCRSLLSSTTKVACKQGQYRSPQTGRCKKIEQNSSVPKPCPEGQSRNPKTNRCRKNPSNNTEKLLASVKDIATPLLESSPSWFIAGTAATGSLGYAVYEWRRDALNWLRKLKDRV